MLRILCLVLATVATAAQGQSLPPQPRPEGLAQRDPVTRFYIARNYAPFWEDAERLSAFATAVQGAWRQGLPTARYDLPALRMAQDKTLKAEDRARLDVAITRAFLAYASDQRHGVLRPGRIDPTIVRDIPKIDPLAELAAFAAGPDAYMTQIVPSDPAYGRLVAARVALAGQDWGAPVPTGQTLHPGERGAAVAALARRLASMGYGNGAADMFDAPLRAAVRVFQADHGLHPDGIAGPATLAEVNVAREVRLAAILVALERWRWMDGPLGRRHVWVNLTEQSARLVQDGQATFTTRAVIGRTDPAQRTPEFSDRMEYMVVNPSWNVPRSITLAEYLPQLQRDATAAPHLQVVNKDGEVVSRAAVNFRAYTAETFPYRLRQPSSEDNALGQVKFMFPNKWNIYLHDTPAKSLFDHTLRAYSHGCVRLADPADFAAAILALQNPDPTGVYARARESGRETVLTMKPPLPVHLVYFTAFPDAEGRMNYRPDIYGRDAALWTALEAAGVELFPADG